MLFKASVLALAVASTQAASTQEYEILSGHFEALNYDSLCTGPSDEQWKADNPGLTPEIRPFDASRKPDDPDLWKDNIFTYDFSAKLKNSPGALLEVTKSLDIVQEKLDGCIKFQPLVKGIFTNGFGDNFNQDVALFDKPDTPGCNSFVGRKQGLQRINLGGLGPQSGNGCGVISTVHEIFHALGMFHTQNRPDRDQYVEIHEENIDDRDEDKYFEKKDISTYGVPYDFNSIMQYGSFAFSDNQKPSMTKKFSGETFARNNLNIPQSDIDTIKGAYKCGKNLVDTGKEAKETWDKYNPWRDEKPITRDSALFKFSLIAKRRKLAGDNIVHLKSESPFKAMDKEECARKTLELEGKSFDYSYFGCYVNVDDRKTLSLSRSLRYSYYELKK